MDYQSIPWEAIEQLNCCTTVEEILALADRYGIPLTMEEAEALLMQDFRDLSALNGCGVTLLQCSECMYGEYLGKEGSGLMTEQAYWCSKANQKVYPSDSGYILCNY